MLLKVNDAGPSQSPDASFVARPHPFSAYFCCGRDRTKLKNLLVAVARGSLFDVYAHSFAQILRLSEEPTLVISPAHAKLSQIHKLYSFKVCVGQN